MAAPATKSGAGIGTCAIHFGPTCAMSHSPSFCACAIVSKSKRYPAQTIKIAVIPSVARDLAEGTARRTIITITAAIGKNSTNENFVSSPNPIASPNTNARQSVRDDRYQSNVTTASVTPAAAAISVVATPACPRIGGRYVNNATAISATAPPRVRHAHRRDDEEQQVPAPRRSEVVHVVVFEIEDVVATCDEVRIVEKRYPLKVRRRRAQ